ncbi:MAG: phage holin family protein [Clostridia bacterium]|nr:phage holin family protein [Clostridia bacterium]
MMKLIKVMIGAVCGMLHFLFGEFDILLIALLVLVIVDYITGVFAAIYEKRLNSGTGFRGILKKVAILLVVMVSQIIGQVVGVEWLRSAVIGFYLANEAISILENAGKLDIGIPQKLLDVLEQLKQDKE